jgi:hypothetical protein
MTDTNDTNDGGTIFIYRFKFCNEIMDLITEFSKVHQFDDRKIYKEKWELWLEENSDAVDEEITRLNRLGYEGNIIEKMFKAGRYYFRKKINNEEKKQKPRRSYIAMGSDVLGSMDIHIRASMKNDDFSPASSYVDFCTSHIPLLQAEINRLCYENTIVSSELIEKIKKTYKNRYFMITSF